MESGFGISWAPGPKRNGGRELKCQSESTCSWKELYTTLADSLTHLKLLHFPTRPNSDALLPNSGTGDKDRRHRAVGQATCTAMEDLQERGRAAAILEGVGYLGPEEAEGKHKKNVEVTVQVSDPAVRCRPTSRVSAHVVVKMKMSVVAFLSLLFGRRCRVV